MPKTIKFLTILICGLCANNSFACSSAALTKFGICVRVPYSMFTKTAKDEKFTSSNDSTECIRFYFRRTRKYAGELCASSDPNFLIDRGVVPFDSIPPHARSVKRPDSGLMAMSPLSQYPMELFVNKNIQGYGAIIDCDEVNDPVYRPTSSCHIAAATFQSSKVLFSNFIVKSHINGSMRVSIKEIRNLWISLEAM